MRSATVALGLVGVLLISGACSDVRVLKVPTPTQYDHWDDESQACADRMEGFRFYAQRPFVVVNEPFPLTARSYVVDGLISPDRSNVIVTPPCDRALCDVLKTCMTCVRSTTRREGMQGEEGVGAPRFRFPYSAIRVRGASTEGPPTEEAPEDTTKDDTTPPSLIVPPAPGSVGITDFGVKVSNAPYPTTLLRRYIDIVNLPDFDEQFVIRRYQGLGSVSTDLTLGQGHILQGFNGSVNNEAIATLTLGLIQSGAQALRAAGLSALGLAPLPGGTTSLVPGTPAGDEEGVARLGDLQYEPISLVITIAYFATPGLYPIKKPREVRDWRRLGAFQLRNYSSAIACPLADGGLAIKLGPYGIPYKTFQYVLIEKAATGPTGYQVITAKGTDQESRVSEPEGLAYIKEKILESDDYEVTFGHDRSIVVKVLKGRSGSVRKIQDEEERDNIDQEIRTYANRKSLQIGNVLLPLSVKQLEKFIMLVNHSLSTKGWSVAPTGHLYEDGGLFDVRLIAADTPPADAFTRADVATFLDSVWVDQFGLVTPGTGTQLQIVE